MKKTICDGGCKKGDCNGDCKRLFTKKKSEKKNTLKNQHPAGEITDYHLHFDVLGEMIRKTRKERQMSRRELGLSVGIKESQIFRIENRLQAARFDSIIKVFKALNVKMDFSIEFPDQTVTLR